MIAQQQFGGARSWLSVAPTKFRDEDHYLARPIDRVHSTDRGGDDDGTQKPAGACVTTCENGGWFETIC